MKLHHWGFLAISFLSISVQRTYADGEGIPGAMQELNSAQQAEVNQNKQVYIVDEVSKKPWPRTRVYQKLDASPAEVAAVFSDYALHSSYFPKIVKSDVAEVLDRATVKVDYTMTLLWKLGKSNYTVKDHLSSYMIAAQAGQQASDAYRVDWTQDKGDRTLDSFGNARFEALDQGTLIAYDSFVDPAPPPWGFGWVIEAGKGASIDAVKDVVAALVGQVMKEKTSEQDLLKKQLKALHHALGKSESP